jgi:hypothetical protein
MAPKGYQIDNSLASKRVSMGEQLFSDGPNRLDNNPWSIDRPQRFFERGPQSQDLEKPLFQHIYS